jgi:hypothetical protein
MTEVADAAVSENTSKDRLFQGCPSANILCLDLSKPRMEMPYREFIGKVIAFKNGGGFADGLNERPPLEDIYLLICDCKQGCEGVIRVVQPESYSANNIIASHSGQFGIQIGRERNSDQSCIYAVSIGVIKQGAQATDDLEESNATIAIHAPEGWIAVLE